ncbi:MAG: inositol monophosphatase family protein [Bacteroidales bacterium]|jgi:myo-inositol-1(or 4)-monophosphatase|nr:inositol monophosphatase family protein [Bacteroidales bacterium]MDD4235125.1 inositol monophosphatase family protein [Bacteroidales bacterium]MDY0160643.1 inositol monophosphatase family protein [Bacteroidales bacterium]
MNFDSILSQTIDAAKQAGSFIRSEINKFSKSDIEIKGKNDLVSYVDKTSEKMIIASLIDVIPNAGFIAEESHNSINESLEYKWIIDPLDGTTNYLHGLSPYSVSIALMHHNEVILGVVYEVSNDECFYATKAKGSFLNGEKITCSTNSKISESLFVTGFPVSRFYRNKESFELLDYIIKNSHGIRRLGSAAADLAYVACGRFDCFYEYDLKSWDVAAGSLIVTEAGGKVSDFNGEDNYVFGKEIVAANSLIFVKTLQIIEKFMRSK